MTGIDDQDIVHELLFGPLPDLVVPPPTSPPPAEVVTWSGLFRKRPYRQTWVTVEQLPVAADSDLSAPVIDWCDGPYRGVR